MLTRLSKPRTVHPTSISQEDVLDQLKNTFFYLQQEVLATHAHWIPTVGAYICEQIPSALLGLQMQNCEKERVVGRCPRRLPGGGKAFASTCAGQSFCVCGHDEVHHEEAATEPTASVSLSRIFCTIVLPQVCLLLFFHVVIEICVEFHLRLLTQRRHGKDNSDHRQHEWLQRGERMDQSRRTSHDP